MRSWVHIYYKLYNVFQNWFFPPLTAFMLYSHAAESPVLNEHRAVFILRPHGHTWTLKVFIRHLGFCSVAFPTRFWPVATAIWETCYKKRAACLLLFSNKIHLEEKPIHWRGKDCWWLLSLHADDAWSRWTVTCEFPSLGFCEPVESFGGMVESLLG